MRCAGRCARKPPGDTRLRRDDIISAMGTPRTIERLEILFAPNGTATTA
jgi:Trk K+ transport system NAD-binding subunit